MKHYKECHECGKLCYDTDYTVCPYCGANLFESEYVTADGRNYDEYFGTWEDYEKRLFLKYICGNSEREAKYYRRLDADRNDRYNFYMDSKREAAERERQAALQAAIEYESSPHCQTCGSHNIRKIGSFERGFSVALLGLISDKIGKTFECQSCGYKW